MERKESRLSSWLWLLCRRSPGGEIRIPTHAFDEMPNEFALSEEYDESTHEFVLRSVGKRSQFILINRSRQWIHTETTSPETGAIPSPSSPATSSPAPQNDRPPDPPRRVVITDEVAAQIEERLLRRAAARAEDRETGRP